MARVTVPAISPDASLFEKIITYTPVVLTVVATLLAGLSSSEMTGAQYFRASAAQAQSKAGDQWTLFQTKRSRAINMTTTQDLLWGLGDTPSGENSEIAAVFGELKTQLRQTQQAAEHLAAAPDTPADTAGASLAKAQTQLRQDLATATAAMPKLLSAQPPDITLPPPITSPVTEPELQAALQAIADRQPEEIIRHHAVQVNADDFQAAVAVGERAVQAAEQVTAPLRKELNEGNRTLELTMTAVRAVVRQAREVATPQTEIKPPPNWQALADQLAQSAVRLQTAAEAVGREFLWAKLRLNAAIYDHEAQSNLALAQLYEVQVRRLEADAERHRTRSQRFFMGMLAAQAGVLIASFSLAVRKRSILWSLASVAGVAAILFGSYVYLYV